MKKQILAGTLILTLITAAGLTVRADDDAQESRKAKRAQKEEKQKADAKPRREKAAPGGEQARGTRQQVFARYDRNKNGALDESERDALRADFQRKKHPALAKLDANNDGKIEDKELNVLKGGQTGERPAKRSKEAPPERKKARKE